MVGVQERACVPTHVCIYAWARDQPTDCTLVHKAEDSGMNRVPAGQCPSYSCQAPEREWVVCCCCCCFFLGGRGKRVRVSGKAVLNGWKWQMQQTGVNEVCTCMYVSRTFVYWSLNTRPFALTTGSQQKMCLLIKWWSEWMLKSLSGLYCMLFQDYVTYYTVCL